MRSCRCLVLFAVLAACGPFAAGQVEAADVTAGDPELAATEAKAYVVEEVHVPWTINLEATSFLELPEKRVAIGTRRGDIWLVDGLLAEKPVATWHLFASGLHEVFGLASRDGVLYATQQGEVTRIRDEDGDGRADLFETVSDAWGFGGEHEFAFGSQFDRDGFIWVTLGLTGSYTSEHPFRGWAMRVGADGRTIPSCSGLRSPGGIGFSADGQPFYTESQGPWNGACSLKPLVPGGFMGHPISFPWYELAPEMGPPPKTPEGGRDVRLHDVRREIPQLVPPAVIFPYKSMGQSASGVVLDDTNGRFGPFGGQLFVGDFTLSLVMRVFLEQVGGVWQGACFPFRQGYDTGIIGVFMASSGHLFTGGCNRGWPSRGTKAYALERTRWTGVLPFEILELRARSDGFEVVLTEAADPRTAGDVASYALKSYTYRYQKVYGSPEVDEAPAQITRATMSADHRRVRLVVEGLRPGFIHELRLPGVTAADGRTLVHAVAYYTLNELPVRDR